MIYEQIEGFLTKLTDKTKEGKLDWMPLLAFQEMGNLAMELEEGISGANFGIKSIRKKDSYFLKRSGGYVFLFNICQGHHAGDSSASDTFALMVKINSALPIQNLSSYVNNEEHQKNLAALKELIEDYFQDKYPMPDTLYQFMDEVQSKVAFLCCVLLNVNAGIVTEIGYGMDKSKKLQTISYKPFMELLNTDVLFDVDLQGQGSMESSDI